MRLAIDEPDKEEQFVKLLKGGVQMKSAINGIPNHKPNTIGLSPADLDKKTTKGVEKCVIYFTLY